MPLQQILPTWAALNNANFTSPTGITDYRTGQQFGGGLNLGDYFDVTNDEAANASYTTNGLLFSGRYRLVQVDSGATAANVKTGTVGYLRAGSGIKTVRILTAGSGQTSGTYSIAANYGNGGTGAVITVVVAGGVITSAAVTQSGYGYTTAPTFTVAAGGTPGTVTAQLNTTPNLVTSSDQVATGLAGVPVRPVVFLNSITPGNYGFIQELGTATVLSSAAAQTSGQFANTVATGSGSTGTMAASTTTVSNVTVGQVIDGLAATPPAGTPFKIQMGITAMVVQD